MLSLADAAAYFDRTPILDADTSRVLFFGQVDPYDDSKRDAVAAYRRILSVAPGTVLPASRAVSVLGAKWLIGGSETDGLAEAHRVKYVLHPVAAKYNISTLPGFLSASVASVVWGNIEWLKDGKEESVSSRPIPTQTVYVSKTAALNEYDVVWAGSTAYLTLAVRRVASDFLSGTALRLQHAVLSAALVTRAFNPVTGGYSTVSSVAVNCLRVRWQSLYLYDSQADAKYQEGDCSLVLPASTTVTTASQITLAGQIWAVLSVETLGGAVVVHARLA